MKIAIHIPAFKRLGLLETVLHNLWVITKEIHDEGIELKTFVAGDDGDKQQIAVEWHEATFARHQNLPLGAKINFLCRKAVGWLPDAYVGLGSDDLVTADMFRCYANGIDSGIDYMGILDMYAFQLHTGTLLHWPGYEGQRHGESVGLGRCISKRLMMRLNHEPYDPTLSKSLDGSLERRVAMHGESYKRYMYTMGDVGPVVDVKTSINISEMPRGHRLEDNWQSIERWYGHDVAKMLGDLTQEGEFKNKEIAR